MKKIQTLINSMMNKLNALWKVSFICTVTYDKKRFFIRVAGSEACLWLWTAGRDYRKDFNILLWRSGEYSTPNKEWAVFFINIFLQHTGTWGLLVYYIIFYNILVWSAAPQTPLWRTRSKIRTRDRRSIETSFLIYLQTHSFSIVHFEGTV